MVAVAAKNDCEVAFGSVTKRGPDAVGEVGQRRNRIVEHHLDVVLDGGVQNREQVVPGNLVTINGFTCGFGFDARDRATVDVHELGHPLRQGFALDCGEDAHAFDDRNRVVPDIDGCPAFFQARPGFHDGDPIAELSHPERGRQAREARPGDQYLWRFIRVGRCHGSPFQLRRFRNHVVTTSFV